MDVLPDNSVCICPLTILVSASQNNAPAKSIDTPTPCHQIREAKANTIQHFAVKHQEETDPL